MKLISIFLLRFFVGCTLPEPTEPGEALLAEPLFDTSLQLMSKDSIHQDSIQLPTHEVMIDTSIVNTRSVSPDELVAFAEKQVGVKYKYASIDPVYGFDCSGFITYVFNHFNIKVPRSSIDFTNVGRAIPVKQAKRGDLILFTGTDSSKRFVGHMGIVQSTDSSEIRFIHSSSGKANGVTITPLNKYYQGRFVSIRRVFPENDKPSLSAK